MIVDFPSSKLGQLVGFKGLTIQKVKETVGVAVLHIDDREKAKARSQATIPVEMSGTKQQVADCQRVLQDICNSDQTAVGHLTALINIELAAVGKIMGNRGTTVKQFSEETVCYIEIQQDRSRGSSDTPRLFVAGMPHQVEYAIQLINRFIASPGSKLDFILRPDPASSAKAGPLTDPLREKLKACLHPMLSVFTDRSPVQSSLINASATGGPVALSAFEPDGPKEERIIEIPARKKSHLVGLRGQTIELVQRTAGVLKCHIMVERDKYEYDKDGQIPLQICGTKDRVDHCVQIIERIISGDYSGISHTCHVVPIEQTRVNYLRGDRWQVINYLKDLTGCYMDVIQGPPYGLARGEAQLFMTGPVERVARARAIIDSMLSNMDKIEMPDINVDAPWRRDEEAAKRKMEEEEAAKTKVSRWRRSSPSPR
uniref:K Homology domain-containing protein n=1 Tax=Zooxanthella nutricula TaxID=1333877 RepID=A0A7S2KDH9_9DINO